MYNSIKGEFQPLFKYAVLGSHKSFLQLDHQVDINICFKEATTLYPSRGMNRFGNHLDVLVLVGSPNFKIGPICFIPRGKLY